MTIQGRNIVIGPGGHGNRVARLVPMQQGSQDTLEIWWMDRDGAAKDLSGATLTARRKDEDGDVHDSSGTLTPDNDQVANKGLFTWSLSGSDVDTPGTYEFYFKAVIDGTPFFTYGVSGEVRATPGE
jgi:hypothetical protein